MEFSAAKFKPLKGPAAILSLPHGLLTFVVVAALGAAWVGGSTSAEARSGDRESTVAVTVSIPPPDPYACDAARFIVMPGTLSDAGWTGNAHNRDVLPNAITGLRVRRRCDDGSGPVGAACFTNDDCSQEATCEPTCDCETDRTCEFYGPTHEKRCVDNFVICESDADCAENVRCVHLAAPPTPTSVGGNGSCILSHYVDKISGTADLDTGEFDFSVPQRWRAHLAFTNEQPCPRCGPLEENPQVGDQFVCEGGPNDGKVCTTGAVSDLYGGTSIDCPTEASRNISGDGLLIKLDSLTTEPVTRNALLPCTDEQFAFHPSLGNAFCTDNEAPCSSNADCTRCAGDQSIVCADNADCGASAPCATSPDVTVTCGYYCHCGFCEDDISGVQDGTLPCFSSDECPSGSTCSVGSGSAIQTTAPQQQSNACDSKICGAETTEECRDTFVGFCSEQPFRRCEVGSTTCENAGVGTCFPERVRCFESNISRVGSQSPLGSYCNDGLSNESCTENADCTAGDCSSGRARPQLFAAFCTPAVSLNVINVLYGAAGPGINLRNLLVEFCRCGDGGLQCAEECDDGNTVAGDGCDALCKAEPAECGNGIREIPEECDDGNTTSGDGCDENCLREPAVCGDGATEEPEECDDGNTVDGDGCGASCVDEFCGDGATNNASAEECDDGNTVAGDGCDAICVDEFCGDGITNNSTEACDDGNTVAGDGCDQNCASEEEFCGNGLIESGEECDDGSPLAVRGPLPTNSDVDGAFCSTQCEASACGIPVTSGATPLASDALHALRASVQILFCDPRVCDVNGFGGVTAGDALTILRKSVGESEVLACPAVLGR